MHFYYSLGTLGKLKRISWTHFEHLEHWCTLKTGQKQILCLCPALEGIPSCSTSVIIDIFPVASPLLGCAVSGGVGIVADVVPVIRVGLGKKREEDKKTLYHQPPFQSLAQLLLAPSWSMSLEKSMVKFMFPSDIYRSI